MIDAEGVPFLQWCLPRLRTPAYRGSMPFLVQDMREAEPEERFHLVLRRYPAFTYFEASLQNTTLGRLAARMHIGGGLIEEKNETLPSGPFGLVPRAEKQGVYRCAESALRPQG